MGQLFYRIHVTPKISKQIMNRKLRAELLRFLCELSAPMSRGCEENILHKITKRTKGWDSSSIASFFNQKKIQSKKACDAEPKFGRLRSFMILGLIAVVTRPQSPP